MTPKSPPPRSQSNTAAAIERCADIFDNRAAAPAWESDMLDKRPKNTEPAPVQRVLHFLGLDSSRDKADPTSKRRPPNEPEERKHQFATWYVFAAFLGVMLIQYLWLQFSQVETIPYSQFEQLLAENKISEVSVGSDTIQGALKEPLPDGRKLFYTVRVDPALADKLSAHGVKVTGAPSNNLFSTILSPAPTLGMGAVLIASISPRADDNHSALATKRP